MRRIEIKNNYITVNNGYGGNQNLWNGRIKKYGCGLIAISDILLYIKRKELNNTKEYMKYTKNLEKYGLWVLPFLGGIPGVFLALGFNIYSYIHRLSYVAAWAVPHRYMYDCIRKMLKNDIPVLVSVGPAFPFIWKKEGISLYKMTGNELITNEQVVRHYMVITGIDIYEEKEYFVVSSWGKKYYIDIMEYMNYKRKKSIGIFTNILYITDIGAGR